MAWRLIRPPSGPRGTRHDDERGSIVMALLLIMVGTFMAALIAPLVLLQINTSAIDTRRDHALAAAQAGVDVAIGRIRASTDSSGLNGSLTTMPCTRFLPITGTVASSGKQAFKTNIFYFSADPRGHDEWMSDPSKQITCVAATSGLPNTPAFAVVLSVGTDRGANDFTATRTVQATYVFKTQNKNIPGGLIHSYNSNPDLCIDAGSSSPAVGTVPNFRPCSSGTDQQIWSYNTDLTISLVSTIDPAANDLGLCLTAAFPHTAGNSVTLQKCASTTTPEQQWSYTGNNNMPATKQSSGNQDSVCLMPASPNTAGSNLVINTCGARDTTHALQPDASVGAGNADASKNFLVNYNEFGRCLDVTNGSLPSTDSVKFLIAYPCKVTPDTTNPPKNQQWNLPTIPSTATFASGQITSFQDSTYCLTSPMTLGGYPYMLKCDATKPASQKWTVWGDTGDYTQSYRITDSATPSTNSTLGYCLQPTDPTVSSPDNYTPAGNDISKIAVTTCSGSTLQKWNAPAGVQAIPVRDYHEN